MFRVAARKDIIHSLSIAQLVFSFQHYVFVGTLHQHVLLLFIHHIAVDAGHVATGIDSSLDNEDIQAPSQFQGMDNSSL